MNKLRVFGPVFAKLHQRTPEGLPHYVSAVSRAKREATSNIQRRPGGVEHTKFT